MVRMLVPALDGSNVVVAEYWLALRATGLEVMVPTLVSLLVTSTDSEPAPGRSAWGAE